MPDTPQGDALDQLAEQQQAPAQQAAQPATVRPQQAVPQGGDGLDQVAASYAKNDSSSGGMLDKASGFWHWANQKLDQPLMPESIQRQLKKEDDIGDLIIRHEIASAHPWRAALAQFYYGSMKDAGRLAVSMTSGKQLALQILSGAQSTTIKAGLALANLYFAFRGAKAMFEDGKAAINLDPDAMQNVLFGASSVAFGAAGAGSDVRAVGAKAGRDFFGLSGDLQAKVNARISANNAIRQQGVSDATQARATAERGVRTVRKAGEVAEESISQEAAETQAKVAPRMGQILADAMQAVHEESGRVSKPFEDMAARAQEPVTDARSMRSAIIDTITSHGIQEHEIPPKVFDALAKRGMVSNEWFDIPAGPAATSVEEIASGLKELKKPVTFSDTTRVRDDLWNAARTQKDGAMRNALYDAYDSVTKMQEDYAAEHGFGRQYQAAKADYMKFRRELGSGLMSDFLSAENYSEQQMGWRVSKLLNARDAEALQGLLRLAGVDVSPLTKLVSVSAQLEKAAGAIPKGTTSLVRDIRSAGETAAEKATAAAEGKIRDLHKDSPLFEKAPTLEFRGKTTDQIRSELVNQIAQGAKARGISHPYGMAMITVGLLRMAAGSAFGLFTAALGLARTAPDFPYYMVRNKSFQDWMIRESGISPSNRELVQNMRRAISNLGPTLRRISATRLRSASDATLMRSIAGGAAARAAVGQITQRNQDENAGLVQ